MNKPVILICDDEEGIRESLRLILDGDYTLRFAADGDQALQQIHQSPPDLLFLDMKLPRMDGLETLRRIRDLAPQVPVLILTAYHSMEIAKEAVRLGAADYIPKPFDGGRVLQAIRQALERVRARNERGTS